MRHTPIHTELRQAALNGLLRDAIRKILASPGWEKFVQENWVKIQRGGNVHEAGMVNNALLGLLIMVSSAVGAKSADELISKVTQSAKQETVVKTFTQADVQKVAEKLPALNKAQMIALNNPFLTPSWETFAKTLGKMVKDGLKSGGDLDRLLATYDLPQVEKNKLTFEAFKWTVDHSPEKADLGKYLAKVDKDLNAVNQVVQGTIKDHAPVPPVAVHAAAVRCAMGKSRLQRFQEQHGILKPAERGMPKPGKVMQPKTVYQRMKKVNIERDSNEFNT